MQNQLNIYRNKSVFSSIAIDENTVFSKKLPGTELITCPVIASDAIDFREGDYIIYNDQVYTLNILPKIDKGSDTTGKKYELLFEARFYQLLDTYVQHLGSHEFPYYGTAADQLKLIIESANRDGSGWTPGTVAATAEKNLDYNWTFVRTALDNIAAAFGLEYQITGTTVNMVKMTGRDTGLVLQYGRGKGLHQISRSSDASKNIVNRVYGIGGTRNLGLNYREGKEKNLVFESRFVETPGVSAHTERVKEGKYENSDIFPQFKGTVKSVTLNKGTDGSIISCSITDPAIDFNLNEQLQDDKEKKISAKVSFLKADGPLVGIEFEISAFDFATKTIQLINNNNNGYILPNETNYPKQGDQFTLYDLKMPDAYIAAAEARLKAETQQFLDDNRQQRLIYAVKPDEKYLRENQIRLQTGDRAQMKDADLQVDEVLRFTEISFPLVNPYDVTAIIGNDIRFDRVSKLFADVLQAHQDIQVIDNRSMELAKKATANLRALEGSIFDTDGLFDMDKLNMGVLTAALGIFGVKSQNFILSGVYITDNYKGDPNAISLTSGELIHMEISNSGEQNRWQMQALTQSGLKPATTYYVYSKCSKTSQAGSFVVSADQVLPEAYAGYYMFLTGVVYPVREGLRDAEFSNGITSINGNRIKTGKIESPSGELVINLLTSEIFGKVSFKNTAGVTKSLAEVDHIATTAQGSATAAMETAEMAREKAEAVIKLITDISDDGILDSTEKAIVLKDYLEIYNELEIMVSQAGNYNLDTIEYTNNWGAITYYLTEICHLKSAENTIIDRTLFNQYFVNYYNAKQNLIQRISVAAKKAVDTIQIGGRNLIPASDTQLLSEGYQFLFGRNLTVPLVKGQTYIFSCVYQGNTASFSLGEENGYQSRYYIEVNKPFEARSNSTVFLVWNEVEGAHVEISQMKLERGNRTTDWTRAPEDLQESIALIEQETAAAVASSSRAIALLDDISNDGILDVSEKQSLNKEYVQIYTELDSVRSQAALYGVDITDYSNQWNNVIYYCQHDWLSDMNQSTPVDRGFFNEAFRAYYNAKQSLLEKVTGTAKALLNNLTAGGRNLLRNTYNFKSLDYWFDNGGGITIDGPYTDGTQVLRTEHESGIVHEWVTLKANTEYVYSAMCSAPSGFSGAAGHPLHMWVSTAKAGDQNVHTEILGEYDTDLQPGIWKRCYVKFKTPADTRLAYYMRPFILPTGLASSPFYVTQICLHEGNVVTDWSPAPEDLQEGVELAQQSANTANQLIADLADDNIISPAEKPDLSLKWGEITREYPIILSQAKNYGLDTAAYTTYYNVLNEYMPGLIATASTSTSVNGYFFKENFINYYQAKISLLKSVSDQAKTNINNVNFGGVNLLKNSGDFVNTNYWDGVTLEGTFDNGYGADGSAVLKGSNVGQGSVAYYEPLVLKPDTVYTYSGMIKAINYTGAPPHPLTPLHFWLGSAYNTGDYDVKSSIITDSRYLQANVFTQCFVTFKTPDTGSAVYMKPWVYVNEAFSEAYFTHLQVAEESKPSSWKKSPLQVKTETERTAHQITDSKIDTAISGLNFGGVNLLKNSGDFVNTNYWDGVTLEGVFDNGYGADGSGVLKGSNVGQGSVAYNEPVALKPGTVYTYSGMIKAVNYTGAPPHPLTPLHFWLGSVPNTGDYDVKSSIITDLRYMQANVFTHCHVTFKTPDVGSVVYMKPWIYVNDAFSEAYFTHLQVAEESKPGSWKKSAFQIKTETERIAHQVSESKIEIEKAAILSDASFDAQSRVTNAYTAVLKAATEDAQLKAKEAYDKAVTEANQRREELKTSLGDLAYKDLEQVAIGGKTLIEGGLIRTTLLDVDAIRAKTITAGNIEGLNLNFSRGSIGGIYMSDNNLYSTNGNFSLTENGSLTAKNGDIGGIKIGKDSLYTENNKFSLSADGTLKVLEAEVAGIIRTKSSGRRMEINSKNNSLVFYNEENYKLTAIKDDVDHFIDDDELETQKSLSGIVFNKKYSSNSDNPDEVKITGNGIYSNSGAASALLSYDYTRGVGYGSVVGYIRRDFELEKDDVQAGIMGIALPLNSFGGHFRHMQKGGTALCIDGGVKSVDAKGVMQTGLNGTYIYYISAGNFLTLVFANGICVGSNMRFNSLP